MKAGINAGIDTEINALAQLPAVKACMATCDKCHSHRLYRVVGTTKPGT